MADKEAAVFVFDVAQSMGQRRSGRDRSDLDWSLDYVWDKVSTIVGTGRKTLMVGVIGIGTDKTDHRMKEVEDDPSYDHISLLQPIAQLLLPDLQRLPRFLKPSKTNNRDILSGIIVGVDLITKHCKQLKYKKKLTVITNGIGALDDDDVEATADVLKKNDIELLLLGIDFDDAEYGYKEEDKSPEKAHNEGTLKRLADLCGGRFATMQEAIDGLAIPEMKQTRPTPTYRGYLRLGDEQNYDTALTIDIERYFKVAIRRPPTATTFAIKQNSSADDGLTDVKQAFYYSVKDPSGDRGDGTLTVDRDELAKGYEYGRTAVHISESDENITKLETFSSYDILGFIPAENIERYMIIDSASMLVPPRNNDKAALALSSFVHALYELGSVAVGRLVKKDGAEPILALLSPHIDPDFECLIENVLPFAEDMRKYRFPPLDKVLTVSGKALTTHLRLPSEKLLGAMSDFVDSMSLVDSGPTEDQDVEILPIDETYSPVLHTIEGAIKHRAVHPDAPLPPRSELFSSYMQQPARLQEAAKPALDRLIAAAEVKKIPPKQKGRKRYREAEKPISGLDIDALFEPTDGSKRSKIISKDNAIPEFKRAIDTTGGGEAVARELVKQMMKLVENLLTKSFGDSNYARATELLGTVREELKGLEFANIYKESLTALKKKVKNKEFNGDRLDFWFDLRKAKLGLITKSEQTGDPAAVDEEEAAEFWNSK